MRFAVFSILLTVLWTTLLVLAFGQGMAMGREAGAPHAAQMAAFSTESVPISVTTFTDELTVNGNCSLREAIQAANTDVAFDGCPAGTGIDTVLLPAGLYKLSVAGRGEDNNATGDLDILSSLVISGSGALSTTIDAGSIDRAMHVFSGTVVSIQDITIRNGKATDGSGPLSCGRYDFEGSCDGEPGGGIYNSGRLTITNTDIIQNHGGDGARIEGYYIECPEPGGAGGAGGGIFNQGDIILYTSRVISNAAGADGSCDRYQNGNGGNGGGIANVNGRLTLYRSVVAANQAAADTFSVAGYGGGIYNTGILSITGSTFVDNASHGAVGGGLFNSGQADISDSSMISNTSSRGGAIANHSTLRLVRSVIDGNRTNGFYASGRLGGGLYNSGSFTVENSTIRNNRTADGPYHPCGSDGGDGGGFYNSGLLTITNSTISSNRTGDGRAGDDGGGDGGSGAGIFNTGALRLENTTLSQNRAGIAAGSGPSICDGSIPSDGRGGAISNAGGTASLRNNILADNQTSGNGVDCWGTLTSAGYNLIQNSAGCTLAGDSTGNILDHYAWLEPLADNGGPTPTHALRPQSLALNAGSCIDSDEASVATDQRGEPRPQGGGCDMGAFESYLIYTPPLMVHLPTIEQSKN